MDSKVDGAACTEAAVIITGRLTAIYNYLFKTKAENPIKLTMSRYWFEQCWIVSNKSEEDNNEKKEICFFTNRFGPDGTTVAPKTELCHARAGRIV